MHILLKTLKEVAKMYTSVGELTLRVLIHMHEHTQTHTFMED